MTVLSFFSPSWGMRVTDHPSSPWLGGLTSTFRSLTSGTMEPTAGGGAPVGVLLAAPSILVQAASAGMPARAASAARRVTRPTAAVRSATPRTAPRTARGAARRAAPRGPAIGSAGEPGNIGADSGVMTGLL